MSRSTIRAVLALGATAAVAALPVVPAQAATCTLSPTVTATAEVQAALVGWNVTATGCTTTPAVEFEVRDQAAPTDAEGIVVDSLATSGSQSVPGLIGGHTYDVTLTASADGEGAQDVATVVPLAGEVIVRADKVSLEAHPNDVSVGGHTVLSGAAKSIDDLRAVDRRVTIERKVAGGDHWVKEDSVRTDAKGKFSVKVEPSKNTTYRALVDNATSSNEKVDVHYVVKAKIRDARVARGSKVTVVASVKPGGENAKVELEMRVHGHWKSLDKATTKHGDAVLKFNAKRSGQVRVTAQGDREFESGTDTARLRVARVRHHH